MCYDLEQQEARAIKRSNREKKMKSEGYATSTEAGGGESGGSTEATTDYYRASGFDHPYLLVISSEEPNHIQRYHWGLIPSWVKTVEQALEMSNNCLNAKCESVFEKPSFRNIIMKKRALLPVDGFYEHRHLGKDKYPYFIHMKDKEPFYLGCVYDTWKNPETGEIVYSFSVITTPANELCAKIHNKKLRMPFIVGEENVNAWLDLTTPKEAIQAMMKPYDDNLMDAHTVQKPLKNNPNAPDKWDYPELGMFD
jgi:putative SOS response-associated peptidase YedK